MKYRILLISLVVFSAITTLPHSLKRFSESVAYTNHWAMAALFWSGVFDSPSDSVNQGSCYAHETTALASAVARTDAGAGNAVADNQEDFRWQGRIQSGQTLEVKGVNGSVRAEGTSGSQIEVVAEKSSRRSDTKAVEIRVLEHAGGVTICAVYPSDDASRPNECQPGRGGRMNVHNNDVQVNFIVKVPAGVRFAGRTVNGDVEAQRIGGDVDASTVNGSIEISASGIAQASTVNGSIKALMGSGAWADELKFNTVNGSITLDFPSNLGADLRAETLNGDISSDFPMNMESAQEGGMGRPRRIAATIGSGGRALNLKTVNGDIKLRRAAERAM
jgi:hypothetical protein